MTDREAERAAALAVRRRFSELAERDRLAPRREAAAAQDDLFAIHDEWRRAEAVLNELEHPEGPNLNVWTVDALREVPLRLDLDWKAFDAEIERLRRGDRRALECTVRYLEADPWYPSTGHHKEKLLRYIARIDITGFEDRLRAVVLTVARSGRPRRELRLYARLAARVMNDDLRQSLEAITQRTGAQSGVATYILRGGRDTSHPRRRGLRWLLGARSG